MSTQNFVSVSSGLGGCGSKKLEIPSKYIRYVYKKENIFCLLIICSISLYFMKITHSEYRKSDEEIPKALMIWMWLL